MSKLYFDIETYSECPIKHGTYRYAEDGSTEVLITAWAFEDDAIQVSEGLPDELLLVLDDPSVVKCAWNTSFERVVLSPHCGLDVGNYLDVEQWDDPMARAKLYGYPGTLAGAGEVLLGVEDRKDTRGKKLIRLFSEPDKRKGRASILGHPDDWELFKEYCRQDVHTLRELDRIIPAMSDKERSVWLATERINDRGVAVDLGTARLASRASAENKKQLQRDMAELTGLENPNSPTQLCGWLSQRLGSEVTSVAKGEVEMMLKRDDLPEDVRSVLVMRQALGLTAAKKFDTFQDMSNSDERLRGVLRYHGAHSGRWTAKGLNLQNLPHDKISETDVEAMRVDLLLGRTPPEEDLKKLVRPTVRGGLCVVDFSQIEARVLPWIAGDEKTLEAFRAGRDLYTEVATAMGTSFSRQDGKVATLACLPATAIVTTSAGDKPIVNVSMHDCVWDGTEWVHHDGVIYQGERRTITYGPLTATHDHLVFTTLLEQPVPIATAARLRAPLAEHGTGEEPLRTVGDHRTRPAVQRTMEPGVRTRDMSRMRINSVGNTRKLNARAKHTLSNLQRKVRYAYLVEQAMQGDAATVREPKGQRVPKLWSSWNNVRLPVRSSRSRVGHVGARSRQGQAARPRGQRPWLRTRKYSVGYSARERLEQTYLKTSGGLGVPTGGMAVRKVYRGASSSQGSFTAGYHRPGRASRRRQAQMLAYNPGSVAVYDLLNCGPRSRFTADGVLVHNCGYGGGWRALLAFGGANIMPDYNERYLELKQRNAPDKEFVRLDRELRKVLESVVKAWRDSHPEIVRLWRDLENDLVPAEKWFTSPEKGVRGLVLPSGRQIMYRDIRGRSEETPWGDVQTKYTAADERGGRLTLNRMTLSNNLVQGTARDILAEAIIRLDKVGYRVVNMVHDEVLVEAPESALLDVIRLMTKPPSWARDLPIAADGYYCENYVKK